CDQINLLQRFSECGTRTSPNRRTTVLIDEGRICKRYGSWLYRCIRHSRGFASGTGRLAYRDRHIGTIPWKGVDGIGATTGGRVPFGKAYDLVVVYAGNAASIFRKEKITPNWPIRLSLS